jgi:hypothetical protein
MSRFQRLRFQIPTRTTTARVRVRQAAGGARRGDVARHGGAVHVMHPVDPWLESAWTQPLSLRRECRFQSCLKMRLVQMLRHGVVRPGAVADRAGIRSAGVERAPVSSVEG